MSLQIKIFQVGDGDAMSISYGDSAISRYNIFIDAGYLGSYFRTIKQEILDIKKIDLWILTHIDEDHINGIVAFLSDPTFKSANPLNYATILKKVWLNMASKVPMPSISDKTGFKRGISLRDKLLELAIPIVENISNELSTIEIGGAKIIILSPDTDSLVNLKIEWIKKESEMIKAGMDDYGNSIADLANKPDEKIEIGEISNRSSIAFLFEYKSIKILFMGDAHPDIVIKALQKLKFSTEHRCRIDYMKLSHHGSKENFQNSLLDIIDCDNFIISAIGGNNYNLPNKIVLAKILCHAKRDLNKQIRFIFNHDNSKLRRIFANDKNAERDYNFRCLYPKAFPNAFTIPFDC